MSIEFLNYTFISKSFLWDKISLMSSNILNIEIKHMMIISYEIMVNQIIALPGYDNVQT